MVDKLKMQDTSKGDFPKHPVGAFGARCIDVIDLGHSVVTFPGQKDYLAQKMVLVFYTGEYDENTGEPVTAAQEYTLSGSPKGNLRKVLESWRGRPYTDEEVRVNGFPLDSLYNVPVLVTVSEVKSKKGKGYAKITALSPLPKGMVAPDLPSDYVRDDFWINRKTQYTLDVEAFYTKNGGRPVQQGEEKLADELDKPEQDLPF